MLIDMLGYPPIARGFVLILAAGAVLPIIGVFVVRLNLITLRFMLMHGTLLGGAAALAIGFSVLPVSIMVNLALVLLIIAISRSTSVNIGLLITFFMVLSVGLAFLVIYRAGVPAKDTLEILWGNLYAITPVETIVVGSLLIVIIIFFGFGYRRLTAVLFSREVAYAVGIREAAFYNGVLILTSLSIAIAMRLIGALLLDALVILPAIAASFFARSAKRLFIYAGAFGLTGALAGFIFSIVLDIPVSSATAIVAAILLGTGYLIKRRLSV